MPWVSRSAWGARPPSGSYNQLSPSPKGHAIHWEGPHMGTQPHDKCDDTVRGIQSYHMDKQGWSDIAYNIVVCTHGYQYEGRGKGKGSAANGTSQANYDWYAICALVGEGDAQPPELIQGLKDAAATARSWGAGNGSTGHRDHIATACPGDALYGQVKAGTFTSGGSAGGGTTPPPSAGTAAPPFPYPSSHYLGQARPDPACHSGYYASDQPNVRKWQQRMKDRGWTIGVDGLYGPQSESVCRSFQAEKGLAVDGLVGPKTWSASWTAPVT